MNSASVPNPAIWDSVVKQTGSPNEQALIAGAEFRIDIRKALEAIGKSVAAFTALAAASSTLSPLDLGTSSMNALLALGALKTAVISNPSAAEFIVCVVISEAGAGKTVEQVSKDVAFYLSLTDEELRLIPSHLGINRQLLDKAQKNFSEQGAIKNLLQKLIAANRATVEEGRYRYNDSIVTLSFS